MVPQRVKDSVLGTPDTDEKQDLNDLVNPPDNLAEGREMEPVDAEIMPGDSAVVDSMIEQLARWAEEDAQDDGTALASIVASAWNARDDDELLSGGGAIHARDILDTPLWVTHVTVVPSDVESDDGCPFYMAIHGTRGPKRSAGETGPQPVVVTCGGWRVVGELGNLRKRGSFPKMLMIVNARKVARKGKMPLKLSYAV